MHKGGNRAIIAALLANFGIAIAKFVGFLVTGAASMQAEAVHSLADTGNQVLLLWGSRAARQEASREHSFGYGRERFFWAFVVSQVIFILGALFAIYEGVHKLKHPEPLENQIWAVGILVLGIVLEGFSFRTAIVEAKKQKRGQSWWAFIRGTKNPELPVVILEDFGALCGLVIAIVGIGLATVYDDARFDAMGSIAIGVLLGAIAIALAIEMKSLLIGESAKPTDLAAIKERILACDEVRRIIHMRTQHMGPEDLLVAVKLEFEPSLSFAMLTEAINRIEVRVRDQVPVAKIIYIEPDLYDPKKAR